MATRRFGASEAFPPEILGLATWLWLDDACLAQDHVLTLLERLALKRGFMWFSSLLSYRICFGEIPPKHAMWLGPCLVQGPKDQPLWGLLAHDTVRRE